jgi:hypothetical protein
VACSQNTATATAQAAARVTSPAPRSSTPVTAKARIRKPQQRGVEGGGSGGLDLGPWSARREPAKGAGQRRLGTLRCTASVLKLGPSAHIQLQVLQRVRRVGDVGVDAPQCAGGLEMAVPASRMGRCQNSTSARDLPVDSEQQPDRAGLTETERGPRPQRSPGQGQYHFSGGSDCGRSSRPRCSFQDRRRPCPLPARNKGTNRLGKGPIAGSGGAVGSDGRMTALTLSEIQLPKLTVPVRSRSSAPFAMVQVRGTVRARRHFFSDGAC